MIEAYDPESPARRAIELTAQIYSVPVDQLIGPTKEAVLVDARRALMVALRRSGFGLQAIADIVNRDHSTVYHHLQSGERLLSGNLDARHAYAVSQVMEKALGVLRVPGVSALDAEAIRDRIRSQAALISRLRDNVRSLNEELEAASRIGDALVRAVDLHERVSDEAELARVR